MRLTTRWSLRPPPPPPSTKSSQGLPYHISALYLVDLDRFRTLAAGDKLRILYERLSKDPNSLSNLDQVRDWAL